MSTADTPPLVIAVEPDAGTRRLFHLILQPLEVRLLTADALDSEEFQQLLAQLEPAARRGGTRPPHPPDKEKNLLFINGNLLSQCDPPALEDLRRLRGAGSIFAVLEPGVDALPVPLDFHLDGNLSKPLKPSALLAAVAGKRDEISPGKPTPGSVAPPREDTSGEGDGILKGFLSLIAETDMDRAMIDELTLSFIARGEEYLAHLGDALHAWDKTDLDRISHTMKGMSGNLRFSEISALCERLNLAAKGGNQERGREIYRELEDEFHRVHAAIKTRWRPPD